MSTYIVKIENLSFSDRWIIVAMEQDVLATVGSESVMVGNKSPQYL